MKINSSNDERANFWISYADLMAGLLFVFILVVGGVVVKYVLTQTELSRAKSELNAQMERLGRANSELNQKEQAIKEFMRQLNAAQDKNLKLDALNELFSERLSKLNTRVNDLNKTLESASRDLSDMNETNSALSLAIVDKDEKILALEQALAQKNSDYELLLSDLRATKESLKNLSSTRLKVIAGLKAKMGDDIGINPSSGALTLPSGVLFDVNSFTLKNEAKAKLRKIMNDYLAILLSPEIKPYVDKIMIEGHTDSDGTYLYNLNLSQKRAFAVMDFIYSFYKNPELQKHLVAIGRSCSDLIIVYYKEDATASRRIEIKFSLKDQNAIREIERILQQNGK